MRFVSCVLAIWLDIIGGYVRFQNSAIEKAFLYDVVSKMYVATDSSPVDMQSYELCCDMIDVVIDISWIYGYDRFVVEYNENVVRESRIASNGYPNSRFDRVKDETESFAFDDNSASVIKLNNGTVLYFREVGHCLAVVCILREENFERRGTFIDSTAGRRKKDSIPCSEHSTQHSFNFFPRKAEKSGLSKTSF
jgi:hypothetical protein